MANSNITGLLREINTNDFVKNELSCTMNSLKRNLEERYVKRIKNTISYAQKESIQTPTKEANLLMAIREFANENERDKFDMAIDMLNSINTVNIIQKDISELSTENCVHSLSGETTENTSISPNLANALLMLSIFKII